MFAHVMKAVLQCAASLVLMVDRGKSQDCGTACCSLVSHGDRVDVSGTQDTGTQGWMVSRLSVCVIL